MRVLCILFVVLVSQPSLLGQVQDNRTLRVFIFAGQSNMEGSDSKVKDIERFPPFRGLEEAQKKVRFFYCLGREKKKESREWTELQPVDGVVGPELSFARAVRAKVKAPIAIIKVAAGGTHLGGDWNPEEPTGFKLYPLALARIQTALLKLKKKRVRYRLEGFVWHQGENDMFNDGYRDAYGKNLKAFIKKWRKDLNVPDLRFYVGGHCTKTIWGMDNRSNMYAIEKGQRAVCEKDKLTDYVPTAHVGVEIGGEDGLHYHYGTLGQLEHGVAYANAYLKNVGATGDKPRKFRRWPYKAASKVKLFVFAGHRNMEGERAFVDEIPRSKKSLSKDNLRIAFKYDLGQHVSSDGFEPLGPVWTHGRFGPELSFAAQIRSKIRDNVAICKFTHSGSQIIDWTPKGSEAETRNLYKKFIAFIEQSIKELKKKGHRVELAGIVYHVGENDMSYGPYRRDAAKRLGELIAQSRKDLKRRKLRWFVSQQPPTDLEALNKLDVTKAMREMLAKDKYAEHWLMTDLPKQEKVLVLDTAGVLALGESMAKRYLEKKR